MAEIATRTFVIDEAPARTYCSHRLPSGPCHSTMQYLTTMQYLSHAATSRLCARDAQTLGLKPASTTPPRPVLFEEAVENSIDELRRLFAAIALGKLHSLIDGDLTWCVRIKNFVRANA